MLVVGLFMFIKKGTTLVETLLAFNIFVSCVVIILSCYNLALNHYQDNQQEYKQYIEQQKIKERQLWSGNDLYTMINEVLP